MTEDASPSSAGEAAGETAGGPLPPPRDDAPFPNRKAPPPTARERQARRDTLSTGRIAAVAEEEGRKLQAEDPKAIGGFWVRDRKNNGLIYVVPTPDPKAEDILVGGDGEATLMGRADEVGSTEAPVDEAEPGAAVLQAQLGGRGVPR